MIAADVYVPNNLPINPPLGNQVMPKATPIGDEFDSGIKRKLYQLPVVPFRDAYRGIHTASFCNTNGSILPCYVSPSLNLNRVYANPEPVMDENEYQPMQGNARNQAPGLATDANRLKLFQNPNFIPNQTTAGVMAGHFKKN
mgnify:CR=1 FL=1